MKGSAIILRPEHRDELFETIPFESSMPARDMLVFSLSHFEALRVCEIAKLEIGKLLGPRGEILDFIRVEPHTSKRDGRTIKMHPRVRQALEDFLDVYPDADWVAISPRGGPPLTAAALGRAMERLYRDCGFGGCRSHTGRATCLSEMARLANLYGCNLAEVQRFAGHKRLETTANYLGATGNLAGLVDAIGTNNHERRDSSADKKSTPTYWTPASRRRFARRASGPHAAGQSRPDSDGRSDEERLAAREQRDRKSRRKLRQHRPFRRDR
jgi:integrase/recombinase XerD